ncbi:MAG: transposase [Eggerthellaceae bacterium]|nr:transposase [Eggerthellaceae bacterium]
MYEEEEAKLKELLRRLDSLEEKYGRQLEIYRMKGKDTSSLDEIKKTIDAQRNDLIADIDKVHRKQQRELEKNLRKNLATLSSGIEGVELLNIQAFEPDAQVVDAQKLSLFNDLENIADSGKKNYDVQELDLPSIACVISGKYSEMKPLYLIEKDLEEKGFSTNMADAANQLSYLWRVRLSAVYEYLKEQLLKRNLINAAEISAMKVDEPDRDSFGWLHIFAFTSDVHEKRPICIYDFDAKAKSKLPSLYLSSWSGTLVNDTHMQYFDISPFAKNVIPMAQVYRKFIDVLIVEKDNENNRRIASEAMARLDDMINSDRTFDNVSAADRRLLRKQVLKPKMDEFRNWCDSKRAESSPDSELYKVLELAMECWPYVENILADGRIGISGDMFDWTLGPFMVGNLASLFSATKNGSSMSSGIYSLMQTAKLNGVKPDEYMQWMLEKITADTYGSEGMEELMPWSDEVPDSIKMTDEEFREAARISAAALRNAASA